MRAGFRQAMTWLHTWSGLVLGWLLLVIAAGGTLGVWRRELDAWCHPELARTTVDQAAATAAAVRWLAVHAPHAPGWYIDPADARSPLTIAYWSDGTHFTSRVFSAAGSPDGVRDSLGGEFFYRLHFELQLPYPWGRLLAAGAAELLLVALLTGIVAHRRIFKDFFTLRTAKGQRSWLDAHLILGVLALPFHLAITATGVLTLAATVMPWGGTAAYRGDTAALARALFPDVERAAAGRPAPLAPLAPMLRAAAAGFDGAGLSSVAIANPGDAGQLVTVAAGEARAVPVHARTLTFDGTTGRPLASLTERRPALLLYDLLYGLHMARFADRAVRWLYFLSGLMLTGAIATGLILWTAKQRRVHGFGFRLVERLTIGFCAGLPAAFATLLLLNRLLPPALAAHQLWETRGVFAVWAGALLWAAVRPAARAWPELLGAAGLICAGAALSDLTAAGLPGGPGAGDGVTFGVDGTLLAVAAALAATALRLRRRAR